MPFQNHTKYRQQNPDIKSCCVSYTLEAELDLERKIDAITRYQKKYTKKILTEMARVNPHNSLIISNYIVAQKNEQNIKESTVEGIIKKLVWLSRYLGHKSFSERKEKRTY